MMRKHSLALAAVFSVATISAVRAADEPKTTEKPKMSTDNRFVTVGASGGQMEVDLGKLAAEKGHSDDVKHFGQQMVDDHTKANDELKHLAESKHIDLTKAMDNGAKKTAKTTDQLSKLSGEDFDKAYVKEMVKDHEHDVKLFETESKEGKDEELKAFAAKTLPTLQHHLEMAKALHDKMEKH